MGHIKILHDSDVTINWQPLPLPLPSDVPPAGLALEAGHVLIYVAADIAYSADLCSERGKPRTDYARVYNVIPQDATEERAVEIFLAGWRAGKQTCGASNDDAGIGDLTARNVILWDIPEIKRHTYKTWYIANYPGCWVDFK